MYYIAKVNIETATKKYKPGEKITGYLPDADIAFLKKHNFIASEDDFVDAEDGTDGDSAVTTLSMTEPQTGNGIPGITLPTDVDGIEYKDEAALKKLNKDEIADYAKSIGMTISPDMLKNDMIDSVLNYIGERMAEV